MMAKQVSACKLLFLNRNQLWKQGVSLDQMKVSEKHTAPKKTEMRYFPQSEKSHMIRSNKEVTHKTREAHFLNKKPHKLKIAKNVFQNIF